MHFRIRTNRFTIGFLVACCAILGVSSSQGQNILIATENFEPYTTYTPSPSFLWDTCSRLHTTAPYAYRGLLPQQLGDSSLLTSPTYDFTAYSHVYLIFDHICKISKEDLACIEIKEDYLGAKWHSILSSCYLGKENAYRQQRFSDNSYALWQEKLSEAVPDNCWWKTECFDLSGEAAYSKIQLRFKIKKGSENSGRFAYGWLIDHIRIYAGKQAIPPIVIQLCKPVYADKVNHTGPFSVKFRIENSKPAYLHATYTINDSLFEAKIYQNTDTFLFEIPQTPYEQTFSYSIQGTDSSQNQDELKRTFNNPMPKDGRDSNAACVLKLLSPAKPIARTGDEISIRILLKNIGIHELHEARIAWCYNGCTTRLEWKGALPADYLSDSLSLGRIRIVDHDDSLKIWIETANRQALKTSDTLCFHINACLDYLHGTYRIGEKNADFSHWEAALQQLEHCGTSGTTTFAFDSGEYAIHLNLRQINFAEDSLIFTSTTGNTADVTWTADSTYDEIVRLEKIENIVFRNLTFRVDSLHLQAESAIVLKDSCRKIRLEGCQFLLNTADARGITSTNSKGCCAIDLIENYFSRGRFGVLIWGNTTHNYRTFRAEKNTFHQQTSGGIYLMAVDFSRIGENEFRSSRTPTLSNRNYTGLELYGCYGRTIEQNRFRMYSGKQAMEFGVVLPDSSRYVDVSNNEIIFHCAHAQSVGIGLGSSCQNMRFMHNSLLMDGKTYGNTCVSISGLSDSILWAKNVWVHLGKEGTSARILKCTQPVHTYLCRHFFEDNHYFVPNGGIIYTDYLLKDLKAWQNTCVQEKEATTGKIVFEDTAKNLSIHSAFPPCLSLSEVSTDIEKKTRNSTITLKGAYHSIGTQKNDALVFRLFNAKLRFSATDSLPLQLVLANAGQHPLHKVHLGWEWNGVVQQKTIHFSNLSCGDTLHTSVLAYLHPQKENNLLKVWTFLPNDSIDEYPANDTLFTEYYACDSALSGDYLVGADSSDFPNLDAAVQKALHCGIRTSVRFLIASGIYPTQLHLEGKVPGSSPQKTITITSLAKNADSVLLYRDSTTDGQRSTLHFSHTAHWILENLSIAACQAWQTPYSIAVELMDSCCDFHIQRCRLNAHVPQQGGNICCGIYSSETEGDSLFVHQNKIQGGKYGIYLQGGNSTNLWKHIYITQNYFDEHEDYSIFLRWASFHEISENKAENLCLQAVNGDYLCANRLHNQNHSHCILLTEIGALNQNGMLQISNNECISNAPSPHYGMEIGPYCHDINCLHNSFSVIGAEGGKCLQLQDDPTLWNIRFQNNLFYQRCQGNDTSSISWSEIRSPSAYTFSNNAYLPLDFTDSSNCLQLKKCLLSTCLRLPEVPYDIDKQPRTPLTCMGAYGLPPCNTDACVTALLSPLGKITAENPQAIRIRLGNLGDSALHQLHIHWEIDQVAQKEVVWQGTLNKGDTVSVFLGNIKICKNTSLRIYIEHLSKDVCFENDTLFQQLIVCNDKLSGEFRIGQDFPDLESALQTLYYCGIQQNVRLVLPSGTFYGPFHFNQRIPGCDEQHHITISADSINKSILTLENKSQSAQSILYCTHTAHLIFENLYFEIPENQQEAYAIQLLPDCEDIQVKHCKFKLQTHTQAAVYQKSNWGIDGFQFTDNDILGGRYGIQLSATESLPNQKICICDNLFTEMTNGGIRLNNCHFTEIDRNLIEQQKSCSSGFYGIHLQNSCGKLIDANRIRATRGFYGMYFDQTTGDDGKLIVSNNEIHLNVPSSNCGIYLYNGCSMLSFFHNAILLEGNGTGKCLYTAFNLHNITLKNNQFTNLSGKSSSTDNPVLYFYAANGFSAWQADYNHYYSIGKTLIYAGKHCTDLNSWQQQTGKESHSQHFRPSYLNKNISLQLNNYDSLSCPLLIEVPTDKNGMERTHPTQRGCYQKTPSQSVDWDLIDIESPEIHTACPQAFQSLRIRIRNAAYDSLQFEKHPLCIRVIVEGAIRLEQRCFVHQGCLAPLHSASFTLMEHLALNQSGVYTLTLIVEDTTDGCAANDTLRSTFSIQHTHLPLESNMENAENQMQFSQISGHAQWFKDTSATDLHALSGKAKLCFPSAAQRGSIAQASMGYINLSGIQNPVLSVWYARNSLNKNENDIIRLLVSAEGDSLQEAAVLYRYKAQCAQSIWERADINLSAFAGKCIRLVWEGISFGGGNQYIDSIVLQGQTLLQCKLVSVPTEIHHCQPNAHKLALQLVNNSPQSVVEDSVWLRFDVLSPTFLPYHQTIALSLPAYNIDTLTIDPDFPWECGYAYHFKATLENASLLLADTLNTQITTFTDLGVNELEKPKCSKPGTEISVSASIYNTGDLDVYDIPIEIWINDTFTTQDTIALLHRNENRRYTYAKKLYAPQISDSLYNLEIRIPLECDKDFSDNSCFTRACLQQETDTTFTFEVQEKNNFIQIFPNPSRKEAYLSVYLTIESRIQCEIISPEGQLLYQFQTEGQSGENRIQLPHIQKAKGVYFIRVQYKNNCWIGKWMQL